MSYLETLGAELTAAGIGGRRRSRILAELSDHLQWDPTAELGDPAALARQFADELGTALARRAAFAAFAALAFAGAVFVVGFWMGQTHAFASVSQRSLALGYAGAVLALIGCQVAFVTGVLAVLRAFWRRRTAVVPRREAVTILRRTSVALAAGVVTMIGFGLTAVALRHHAPAWWTTFVPVSSGVAVLVLLAVTPAVAAAARLRPVAAGSAGGLDDDFGPLMPTPLRAKPWTFAVAVAGAAAVVIALAGVVQSDPFDGVLRGLADGVACLAGFAILGRYLSLRP